MEDQLNFKATELRLGLPGSSEEPQNKKAAASPPMTKNNKRASPDSTAEECSTNSDHIDAPPTKTQVVGWPPIRSYRKNSLQLQKSDVYVKVSVDGAPYLRKIDLKIYNSYAELIEALEKMFNLANINGLDFAPTYEDKDGDWMLVGDVPWNMFVSSCNRLRIMKGSEARGFTTCF
ncbi:auxin-induced protein 22D-like [Malus sylvestris]|uniref:auxin-induced protein 22D-like n=1 Tax=Malus sylvestris TaxID=3752 RepID=UPI0021AC0CAB|nr:auxin-induced protein 22D-like [Malus sylvestris]